MALQKFRIAVYCEMEIESITFSAKEVEMSNQRRRITGPENERKTIFRSQ
jgi:hypothetical protein